MIEMQQAFVSDFIAQAFGLPIAHENDDYKPTTGTAWVRLRFFPNEVRPGDMAAVTTNTDGLLQFTLNYPTGQGDMTAKLKAQAIFDAYPLGRRVSYGGETARVTATQQFDAKPEDGWFKVVGRIFYEKD